MPRVVSLFLPTWPTDRVQTEVGRRRACRLRRRSSWSAVTGDGGWCWRRMRPRSAPACASACRRPRRRRWCRASSSWTPIPPADAAALERLALWALQRYAPIVAADPPDGLVIDATGAAHLHGGEDAMLTEMVDAAGRGPASPRAPRSPTAGAPRMRSPAMRRGPSIVSPAG